MKATKNIIYNFNPYTVEAVERRIWRGKELVSLTPKAFDTLLVLLANRGKVVDKDVLLNEVWQDTFVDESTLAQNISTLRKVLGTVSDGKQFIETVPRHGYRFVAEVREIIGEEEIIVVEHRVRTQISAEHKKYSDKLIVQPEKAPEKISEKIPPTKTIRTRIEENRIHLAAAAMVICLILVIIGIGYYLKASPMSTTSFKHTEIIKLSSGGDIQLVKASPDGNYLALVKKQGELSSLQLRQIDSSATIEIVPPKKQQFLGLTFSQDGKQIYYTAYDEENRLRENLIGRLYKVSALGGQIQEMAEDIDSPITISPDGRQFAFVRNDFKENQSYIAISNFDNREEKKLTSRVLYKFFLPSGLAWSPDGRTIVCAAYIGGPQVDIFAVNVINGEQKSLTSEKWRWIASPNWLSDGSGVIFSAFRNLYDDQGNEIWQTSFPEGTVRKITTGTSGIDSPSLSADSQFLVAVQIQSLSEFWLSPANNLNQTVKIKQNLQDRNIYYAGIDWTPDGKIIYGSILNGNPNIWMIDTDGSHNKQITTDETPGSAPIISADGKYIYFLSNRSGKRNIWRMKADGSEQKQLTYETTVSSPSFSADGKYIFYTSISETSLYSFLHKISIDGGESVQLNSIDTLMPQASPDGKWIACYFPKNTDNNLNVHQLKLTLLSAETFQVVKQFNVEQRGDTAAITAWFDNQNFNYITNEGRGSRLWQQSINEDSPKMILDSPDEPILRFAWSKDKQNLIYEKGNLINDLVLIKSVMN